MPVCLRCLDKPAELVVVVVAAAVAVVGVASSTCLKIWIWKRIREMERFIVKIVCRVWFFE